MDAEVSLDNEQQFWDELQEIVSTPCGSEDLIDNTLRAYLGLTTKYKDEYLNSEYDISRCSYKLISSSIFAAHGDYVRRQIIYGLLQEDDTNTLHMITSFLFFDGRQNENTFQMMNEEGAFPRLVELLQAEGNDDYGAGLHRLLMDLLYEMSRIQRVKMEDLVFVDDDFIKSLFGIIEDLSYDANDPYHYPVIRVLLVLNEQFMISAHDPVDERSPSNRLTNKVIKVLSMHGNLYKTFGENIILLINREAETSLQLLTLKLLYLIFTTPPTYEYFYTNDLHVLVDILIRNLLDLPEEASALRHTYLRVLYPLLAHTQLKYPPHYKQDELRRMLSALVRGQLSGGEADYDKILHFEEVDETTRRLVVRCAAVDWMREVESDTAEESPKRSVSPSNPETDDVQPDPGASEPLGITKTISHTSTIASSPEAMSPTRFDEPDTPRHRKLSQVQRLGMHLEPASSSSLSVQEVATQHEKPGVITPSRKDSGEPNLSASSNMSTKPKVKPEPPKARRWRGRRVFGEENGDKIPEEAEPSSSPNTSSDRRNSASTSLAPPPIPGHSRRSASNPPPAVPPPRRSTHPTVQTHNLSGNTSPASPAVTPQSKNGQKPEPPKKRRWGRVKHAQTTPAEKTSNTPVDSVPPESFESDNHDNLRVSVEEAVQNVSIEE
ncbi:hypothetical protein ASPWEDRAFT_33713 [Aspergillus wentii DTO 134E9]|uniref:SPIN90/Ldb17 leucine-rich domain-containing protein n=1 Tax=Aspergillus wentii DTO 134E9 TaxID=1073089 RepID=A0A1L9RZV2_ASPWE|nr:uncharacterized protein ASPWEDRAFT_33713 [Aspergillus wentii DTO 134E9]OJJ40348.1 hypothetical protein ASPWEDRAFT_33713 [Aspergillus wentii DTO 134E9]